MKKNDAKNSRTSNLRKGKVKGLASLRESVSKSRDSLTDPEIFLVSVVTDAGSRLTLTGRYALTMSLHPVCGGICKSKRKMNMLASAS